MNQTLRHVKKIILIIFTSLLLCNPTSYAIKADENGNYPDPLEKINRFFFSFNNMIDSLILRPIAKGYKNIVPKAIQQGINNIYNNFGEISNIINFGLQFDGKNMVNSGKRLLVNSTLGMLGSIDVASKLGYQHNVNGFGKTLFLWTKAEGVYLELPILSSSTTVNFIGDIVDLYLEPVTYIDIHNNNLFGSSLDIIRKRSVFVGLDQLIYGDKYKFKRNLYLDKRHVFLHPDQEIEDDF